MCFYTPGKAFPRGSKHMEFNQLVKTREERIFWAKHGHYTHIWYWRRPRRYVLLHQWCSLRQYTGSFLSPMFCQWQWISGCPLPEIVAPNWWQSRRCASRCRWHLEGRLLHTAAWHCARAEHPGIWAPWWNRKRQPAQGSLWREENKSQEWTKITVLSQKN